MNEISNGNMKNEFVPYNVARRLKDLGFDEKCFAYYGIDYGSGPELVYEMYHNSAENLDRREFITVPLWQQVTRWLRNVHKINVTIDFFPNIKKWSSFSYSQNLNGKEYVKERSMRRFMEMTKYDTYEEALESEIINIVNNNLK